MPICIIGGRKVEVPQSVVDELTKGSKVVLSEYPDELKMADIIITKDKGLTELYNEQFIKPNKSKNKGRNRGKFSRRV